MNPRWEVALSDYEFPQDLRYSAEDEWTRQDEDRFVIGVTDYAQEQLGDIVFVELPELGAQLTRGEPFGVIESVKAVADLYAPVSGEVIALNDGLDGSPEAANEDCYGEGWIIAIRPEREDELAELLDAAAYRAYVAERE